MNDDQAVPERGDNKPQQASMLANVVLLTEKMLRCAREDAWDEVTRHEVERREALALCFSTPVPIDQAELFSEALAAMLHMNEEMIAILEIAKGNVAIKRADQIHVTRSVGHYLDVEKNH